MDVLIALLASALGFAVGYRFRIWFAARQSAARDPDAGTLSAGKGPPSAGA